jgi:hypothetical protein
MTNEKTLLSIYKYTFAADILIFQKMGLQFCFCTYKFYNGCLRQTTPATIVG